MKDEVRERLANQAADVMQAEQVRFREANGYWQNGGNYLTRLAGALLDAGWRPPLPDGGQDLAEHVSDAIADGLAVHSWDGGDHSNHPLPTFAEVATAAVMPFLDEPSASRVFFPGDTVPAGVHVEDNWGALTAGKPDAWVVQPGAVWVELPGPSSTEWQAIVDRASAERREREQAYAAVLKADVGADVAREHGVLPDEDDDTDESTSDTAHADDCTGCDAPGVVPCAADRVIGNWAYRDGMPIKDLEAGRG